MKNIQCTLLAPLVLILSSSLSGCMPRLYKLDIEQGNKLSTQTVSQIKIGMTQDEVHNLLGTPALSPLFQKNRWYYIYYKQPGYGKLQQNHIIIDFNEGIVSHINQDYCAPTSESTPQ